jgi:hypothetical protein
MATRERVALRSGFREVAQEPIVENWHFPTRANSATMTRASRRSTLNPYTTERLAEDHSIDLLRSAETWRLAHPVQSKATKRTRPWIRLFPWRRAPVRTARTLLPLDRPRCESKNAPGRGSCRPLG